MPFLKPLICTFFWQLPDPLECDIFYHIFTIYCSKIIFYSFPANSLVLTLRHNAVWPTIHAAFLLCVVHLLIVALQKLLLYFC
jgi:hypothetical protein